MYENSVLRQEDCDDGGEDGDGGGGDARGAAVVAGGDGGGLHVRSGSGGLGGKSALVHNRAVGSIVPSAVFSLNHSINQSIIRFFFFFYVAKFEKEAAVQTDS